MIPTRRRPGRRTRGEPGGRATNATFAVGALSLALSLSATRVAHAGACIPGAQLACACAGGGSGVQVCAEGGDRLGPCECAAAASPEPVKTASTPGPRLAPERAPAPLPPPAPSTPSTPSRVGRGLVIGGAVSLGLGYVVALVGAVAAAVVDVTQQSDYGTSCPDGGGWNVVPLFGPAVFAAKYPSYTRVGTSSHISCRAGATPIRVYGALDTALQLAGAGMLGAGIALGRVGAKDSRRPGERAMILPGAEGAPSGLTLVVPWR